MGITNSHEIEYEEARKSFTDYEQAKLDESFSKMSNHNGFHKEILEKDPFQSFTSWLLPEQFSRHLFNEMCVFQKSLEQENVRDIDVSKQAFIIALSHFLKRSKEDKAHIFFLIASDSCSVTKQDISNFVSILLDAYVIALKSTTIGRKWKINSSKADNQRFVATAMKELDPNDELSKVEVHHLVSWFIRFPLIEHMFGAVLRACFIDLESIIESHMHGISEGCQEMTGHVPYDRSHVLVPCKFEVNFDETDTLLDIPSMLMLNATLPATLRHRWRLLFSTKKHGESFQSMLHQIAHQGPTLLVIRDTDGHVFGGFASSSWAIKSQFEGDSRCFLFSLLPSLVIYHPTGYNENFMYLNHNMQTLPNGLGMGGQLDYFGIWLDANFGTGHCKGEPCTTYGNPRLSGKENFQIDELEVWGVGVPPEVQLKDRSVLDSEVEAKAFLEVTGKEFHSEGFREPEPAD